METQKLEEEREKGANPEAATPTSREEKAAAAAASPPSSTSSPSHEFSFTISLHPCPKPNKTPPPTFEIDLSPADDIFFHGHLLPLHLSRQAISPRPSDISIEDLDLPIKHIFGEQSPKFHTNHHHSEADASDAKERSKPKSLSSLFGLGRWRKGSEDCAKEEINCDNYSSNTNTNKKKRRFDIRSIWRKYASIVEPLLFFKGEKEKRVDLRRKPYSFSGSLNPRERDGWRPRKRGELSLPTSMRTSPNNSGLLLAAPAAFSTSDESTMEELQSAIQAAIAHCKNSIAMKEDNCKLCIE